MNRRTLIALAASATLALPVAAQSTSTAAQVGSFEATGIGRLVAQGNLTAFGKIDGMVLVRDRRGRAVVRVNGVRQRPRLVRTPLGTVVRVFAIRAKGSFYAQGRGLQVDLRSREIPLSVTMFGRGAVTRLNGEGTYRLNAGLDEQWATAVAPLKIKPPPPVEGRPDRTIL